MKASMLPEYFSIATQNLTHRKKRAWLTVIGIFIGIMAVVALVSLGQGLQKGVDAEFDKLGRDKILVQPKSPFGDTSSAPVHLNAADVRSVQQTRGVKLALGSAVRSARVEWGDELAFPMVASYPKTPEDIALFNKAFDVTVTKGRTLDPGDGFKAIVGSDYADRGTFKDTVTVGSRVLINNKSFEVVGLRKMIGNDGDDQMLFIPASVYEETIASAREEYDLIIVQTQAGEVPATVAESIRKELRQEHNLDEGDEDFTVQTVDDFQRSANTILGVIRGVLTGIAFISLLVGGVGITNTMYTAVLERTKEIGIMKAVGATNEAVLTIFLIESGLLGLGGGLVGVTLGLLLSFATAGIAGQALGTTLVQAYVSWWLIAGGLGFSFLVGALAGTLPARQAAKLRPVETLRYE